MNTLRRFVFAAFVVFLLIPLASAEDSDGDGYDDPSENYTVWDGADAYPNNPDAHEPVFATGCEPAQVTLDLNQSVTFICTIVKENPVDLRLFIDVNDDTHVSNQFEAGYYDLNSNEILKIEVTMTGLSEGVATAKLRIFARANSSESHSIDFPIEVTRDEWAGINSHSEGSSPPDISFINRVIDGVADWLSEITPWEFSSLQAGIILLVSGLGLIGTFRFYRARRVWQQNMGKKPREELETEARFDQIRRAGKHEHHIEQTIPDSPEVIIKRNK